MESVWIPRVGTVENSVDEKVDKTSCPPPGPCRLFRGPAEGEGAEDVSDDRIAQVAIDFISFCFSRRSREWPYLYDEMCYVASNRLYRGLGYEELREAGIDLSLLGLARTTRIVTEVMHEMRRPVGGLVAAS